MKDELDIDNLPENHPIKNKNRELLAELSKVKKQRSELAESLEKMKAELTDIKVNQPINDMLRKLFNLPIDIARVCFDKHVNIVVDDEYNISLRDKSDKPFVTSKDREALFNFCDLRDIFESIGEFDSVLLGGPSGTGAGNHKTSTVIHNPQIQPSVGYESKLGLK